MKLTKFSLMNPNEVDHIEQLQQTVFRPNSFKQAKETAKKLLVCLKNKTKLGKEEKEMMIRLSNIIKSNDEFTGYIEEQYITDCLADDAPASPRFERLLEQWPVFPGRAFRLRRCWIMAGDRF